MKPIEMWAVVDVTRDGESLIDIGAQDGCPIFEDKDIAEALCDSSYQEVARVRIEEVQ